MKRHIFKLGPELSALIKDEDEDCFFDATAHGWSVFTVVIDDDLAGVVSDSVGTEIMLVEPSGISEYPVSFNDVRFVPSRVCKHCNNRMQIRKLREKHDQIKYFCPVCDENRAE